MFTNGLPDIKHMETFPRVTYELENSIFNSKLYFKILPRASVVDCSDTTYMEFILLHALNGIAAKANKVGAEQIDLVADFYHPLSIKGSIRSNRGTGSRIRFVMDDVLPNDLMSSLTAMYAHATQPATPPVPKTRVAAHKIHIIQDRLLKFGRHYC